MTEYYVPYPEAFSFADNGKKAPITELGPVASHEFERASYPGQEGHPEGQGILVYKKGLLFPTKGFVFPQAVQCVNVAKRFFIDSLFLLTDRQLWGLYLTILCTSWKGKIRFINRLLDLYNRTCFPVVHPIAPQRKYLIDVADELWDMVHHFLELLGVEERIATEFAEVFAVCINYDNAYHLRLVDLFSEIDKTALLINPVKEINRVVAIFVARDLNEAVQRKFKTISKLLRVLFLSNRIKSAFKQTVLRANWNRLRYDKIWRYNTLDRGDYNFMGLTYDQRQELFNVLHDFQPPQQLNIPYGKKKKTL